jgi:hypothetical protein
MTSGSRSRAGRPEQTGDSKEVIRRLGHVLEIMVTSLIAEERDRFVHEMTDALRSQDFKEIRKVLSAWLVHLRIRSHPDFDSQTNEFESLVESGELYEEVDLSAFRSS